MQNQIKRSKFLLIFGGIWALCSLPFLLFGIVMLRTELRYESESATAQGTVLSKRMETHYDKKDQRTTYSYYAKYRFAAQEGSPIESESLVDKDAWEKLKEGDAVPVQFIPAEVNQNRIAGSSDYLGSILCAAIGGAGVVIGLGCLVFDLRKRSIIKRLLRDGITVEALVVAAQESGLSINDVQQWYVEYKFQDRRGQWVEGKSYYMPPEAAQRWKSGDKGKVRYAKEDSQQHVWVGE